MKLKQIDFIKTLATGQYNFHENEFWFIEENPSIHIADGILSIYLNKDGTKGTFHAPNSNFNAPSTGNLIKSKMDSGKFSYFLITSWTQDYVSAKGSVVRICEVPYLHSFIRLAKVL